MTYSASESGEPGAGNEMLGEILLGWVANITNDFHRGMSPPSPGIILSTAQWQTGDPLFDIDGQHRPTNNAAEDVAGADIP